MHSEVSPTNNSLSHNLFSYRSPLNNPITTNATTNTTSTNITTTNTTNTNLPRQVLSNTTSQHPLRLHHHTNNNNNKKNRHSHTQIGIMTAKDTIEIYEEGFFKPLIGDIEMIER